MSNFEVGDIVEAKDKSEGNPYSITVNGWRGRVTKVEEDGWIWAFPLEPDGKDMEHPNLGWQVDSTYFKPAEEELCFNVNVFEFSNFMGW